VSYQPCPKPPAGLAGFQPCPPAKAQLGCPSLPEDSSSSYSTEVKVTEESGGVIKALTFPPDPLHTKTERPESFDYRCPYGNTFRYDEY